MSQNWWESDPLANEVSPTNAAQASNWWEADPIAEDVETVEQDEPGLLARAGSWLNDMRRQMQDEANAPDGSGLPSPEPKIQLIPGFDRKPESVMAEAKIEQRGTSPVTQQARDQVQAVYDRDPAGRAALLARKDWRGQVAREIDNGRTAVEDLPTAAALDTRQEAVARRARGAGADWDTAQSIAVGGDVRPVATASETPESLADKLGRMAAEQTGEDQANTIVKGAVDLAGSIAKVAPTTGKMALDALQLVPLIGRAAEIGSDAFADVIADLSKMQSGEMQGKALKLSETVRNGTPDQVMQMLLQNPDLLADVAIPSAGSIFLIGGAGSMIGKAQAARYSGRLSPRALARVQQRAATEGAIWTNAAVNAGAAYDQTEGSELSKYTAALIAGAGTRAVGKITQGGAEGAIARGASQSAKNPVAVIGQVMGREMAQEAGEGGSEAAGVQAGDIMEGRRDGFNFRQIANQATLESAAAGPTGAVVGGLLAAQGGQQRPDNSAYQAYIDRLARDAMNPARAQMTEVTGAPVKSVLGASSVDDAIAAAESASGTVVPPAPPELSGVSLDLVRRQDELLAALEQPQQSDMQALPEQAQRSITERTPAELQMMARHHASPEVREQASVEIARREADARPVQRTRPTVGEGYGRPMESGQPIEQAPTAMEQALKRVGITPEQFAQDAKASRDRAAAQEAARAEELRQKIQQDAADSRVRAGIEQPAAPIQPPATPEQDSVPATPTEDQRLLEKRAIYDAHKESGAPDDVVAQIMLRWQEKANKEASPQNVWRSKNGALGVVPATAQSPFASGELVGTLYPEAKPDAEPVAEQSEQEAALPAATDELILQNRNRATPSSVAQMQSIASAPDYGRLGYSRDFANGAPVVAGGLIPAAQMGRKDFAVAADGRRIPVQYAVVEADSLLPSNRADGTPNADYGDQYKTAVRAIAGNGRVAGLQLAHQNGATAEYLNEMTGDMLHGVNPNTIRKLRNPVLVRVMPVDQVTADIGDVSNTTGNLSLSAVEQARNDVQRVSLDALQFAEDGNVTAETVRQFVRAMPQAEQGGLVDTNGQPTRQAVDRLNAAVFAGAYGNDGLVRLYAQAQDPEARIVMSALAQVAPKMARLEGAGALDIREVVTQAAEIAVNARREGMSIARAAQQLDLAADPLVGAVLDLFAANSRSSRNVADALGRIADLAYTEATKPDADMFGPVPRASRSDVINQLSPQDEQRSQEALEQPAGREPVPVDAVRSDANPGTAADPTAVEASRPAEDEGSQEALTLESYTPAELAQREAEQQARDEAEAKANREADEKVRKENERAEVRRRSEAAADTFELGQSAEDNLSGQGGLQFSRSSPFKPDPYDAQQYAQAVDRIAAMDVAPRTDLTVGDTPAVLRALGAQALPIQMPSSMIHKASRPEVKDHNVPVEVLRQIPALLADPVMVFDSQTEAGALVVLVDANDASGRPVVVAIHLEAKGGGFNRINRIASIYGKDNAAEIGRWMRGSLRYHHKQKAPGWLRAVELQLPEANTIKRLNPRVLTNEDVVNLRYSFAGQNAQTADTMALDTANTRPGITRDTLRDAIANSHPSLSNAVDRMLERGDKAQKGGLVVIESANELDIAEVFASKTGRDIDDAVQMFSDADGINGFHDPRSGITFLVGPNVTAETAPGVLLHEATHGKQRAGLDAQAQTLLGQTDSKLHPQATRDFLVRVNERIEAAGETGNASEAAAYIVELAAIEGRQAGFSAIDGKFMDWIDSALGKRIGNFVRDFVAMVRSWGLRNGIELSRITVDDLVAIAKSNLKAMARGDVVTSESDGARASRGAPPVPPTPPSGPSFTAPELPNGPVRKWFENFRYQAQDRFIDLKRVQAAIVESGVAIRDEFNPYMVETLMHGKAAYRVQQFMESEIQPVLKMLELSGIEMGRFEKYLHARHAKERNAEMAKRNPNQAELDAMILDASDKLDQANADLLAAESAGVGVGTARQNVIRAQSTLSAYKNIKPWSGTEADRQMLSGMSNSDALRIITAEHAGAKAGVFRDLARKMDEFAERTRQEMAGYGLETPSAVAAWGALYKHYVPLKRDMDESDLLGTTSGTGAGISVRGSMVKEATGSLRAVENIFANIVAQREAAIVRGEKNVVAKALYGLVLENPNSDMWSVIRPGMSEAELRAELQRMGINDATVSEMVKAPSTSVIDDKTGLVTERINSNYSTMPNAIVLRVKGEDRVILLSRTNDRAVRLAGALKNADTDMAGLTKIWMERVGPFTRYLAAINTQYNPVFGITNFTRDVQEALLNLESTDIAGRQREVLGNIKSAIAGAWSVEHGDGSHAWASIYTELLEDGGATGFRDQFADLTDRAQNIALEVGGYKLKDAKGVRQHLSVFRNRGMTKKFADLLSDYNTVLENGTRLAVYKAARDAGVSRAQAANIAKDITVNFNRKGARSAALASGYAFFNSAAQGIERQLRTITTPGVSKALVSGLLMAGVIEAMIGIFAFGDDWDEIPVFERERNWILPVWPSSKSVMGGTQFGVVGTTKSGGKYIKIPKPLGFYYIPNMSRTMVEMSWFGNRLGERTVDMLLGVMNAYNPVGSSSDPVLALSPTVFDPFVEQSRNASGLGREIFRENFSEMDPTPGFTRAKQGTNALWVGLAEAANMLSGGDQEKPGMWSPEPERFSHMFGVLTGGPGREIDKAISTIEGWITGKEVPPHRVPLFGRFYGEAGGNSALRNQFFKVVRDINIAENSVKGKIERGAEYSDEDDALASLIRFARADQRVISELRKEMDQTKDRDRAQEIENEILEIQRQLVEMYEEEKANF